MSHPYQCLACCPRSDQSRANILVAASGPFIHTFDLENGNYLSTWSSCSATTIDNQAPTNGKTTHVQGSTPATEHEVPERPQKRQKLSSKREDSGSSAEIVVEGSNSDEDTKLTQPSNPPIIKLACSTTGQYVVAVTGEDKAIRVFELSTNGALSQLSERQDPDV